MSSWVKKKRKKTSPEISTVMQGARFEMEACAFFIKGGYIVYRNITHYGADLVISKDGALRLVEVRGSDRNISRSNFYQLPKPSNLCDYIIYVLPKLFVLRVVAIGEERVYSRVNV